MATPPLQERMRWLVLALHLAREKGLTPVQLQKVLFVLARRRPDAVGDNFYDFQPYHYGPFDSRVYSDADTLAAAGLVVVDSTYGRSLRTYRLTGPGAELAETLAAKMPPDGIAYLRSVIEWAQRLSFNELVRSVYEAFPEMRENSVFRD